MHTVASEIPFTVSVSLNKKSPLLRRLLICVAFEIRSDVVIVKDT